MEKTTILQEWTKTWVYPATHIMLQTTAMQVQYHDLMAPEKQPLLHIFCHFYFQMCLFFTLIQLK